MRPQSAFIEIVERHAGSTVGGIIRPNEIRINGTPLLCPKEETIKVHEIDLEAGDLIKVTMTVFAHRVVMGEEIIEENEQ